MSRREDREAAKKKRARAKMGFVARFLGETPWAVAAGIFPVAVDGVHWLAFGAVNDRFRQLLLSPGQTTILVMLGLYLAYVVSLGGPEPARPGRRSLFRLEAAGAGAVS